MYIHCMMTMICRGSDGMKSEQEQFKEMILKSCDIKENPNCEECLFSTVCDVKEICEKLHNAGYRKATEVIDELVKNIMTEAEPFLSNMSRNLIRMCASKMKKELAAEMRQEV